MDRYPSVMSPGLQFEKRPKRRRELSSPTGKTPTHLSKRTQFQDQTLRRNAWTAQERDFLKNYIDEIGAIPHIGASDFWKDCADSLNKEFGTARSGNMCRTAYLKLPKTLFRSMGTQTQTYSCDTSQETDIVIPIQSTEKKRPHSHFVETLTWDDVEVLEGSENSYSVINSIISMMKNSTNNDKNSENLKLLATLLTGGDVAKTIMELKGLRQEVEQLFIQEMQCNANTKCRRSNESYLYPKDFNSLLKFSIDNCVYEFKSSLPFLLKILIGIAVPVSRANKNKVKSLNHVIPKMALIYSIIMSTRFHELSRMHRVISVALMDSHAKEKVFDRLEKLGVSTSFQGATRVTEEIGNHNFDQVIKKVKDGQNFRIIGDNINMKLGVRHERSNQHGTMYNWFASALITQRGSFTHLPQEPQCLSKDLMLQAFQPTPADQKQLFHDYGVLIARVAAEHLPQLQFLSAMSKEVMLGEYSDAMKEKSFLVTLPVLPLDEQKYADTVEILKSYEETVENIYSKAEMPIQKVHIGGDQLTRERFTGAKGLRSECLTEKDRFDHLGPISFELWHTAMNLLRLIFKALYNEQSFDKGTMNAARIKLERKTVRKDVQNHYDHDKDFFLSFVRSYIVEALCAYFGIDDVHSQPTKNVPMNGEELTEKMEKFISEYVFARNSDASSTKTIHTPLIQIIPLPVTLPDGTTVTINIQKTVNQQQEVSEHDHVKHYGHTVLQLGLLFMNFLDIVKTPDRTRMLTTMKYLMQVFKSSNNNSKYALECLRFLCHQQSSYSLRTATETFYGLFVNTVGKRDSNQPADLKMEHTVKKLKGLYRASGPNKMAGSLIKKSRALSGVDEISRAFDHSARVVVRSTTHKRKSSKEDETKLISDLRSIQPFSSKLGRKFNQFDKMFAPFESKLNAEHYYAWINYHKTNLTYESGK